MKVMRGAVTTVMVAGIVVTGGAAAEAAQGTPPSTCLYERYYPGAKFCDGPWVVSIKEECQQMPAGQRNSDPVCRDALKPRRKAGRTFVARGWSWGKALAHGRAALTR